jgi:hypothetical protein
MATLQTSFSGLKLSNVSLINSRWDFNNLLGLFRNEVFKKQFRGFQGKDIPVKTHYFTWHGRPNVLLTHFLREAIVGLESAVSGAVFTEAWYRGGDNKDIIACSKNPFDNKKYRGTASCVYLGLPELIDPQYSLKNKNPKLWDEVKKFYQEVRNPLFHAYEIESDDPEPVWKALEFIWEIYQWLNEWHPVEKLMSIPVQWNPEVVKRAKEIPKINDLRIKQIIPERGLPQEGREYLSYLPENMQCIQITEVEGCHIPSSDMIDVSAMGEDQTPIKILMSPHAAMKLLSYLAIAHHERGWELPDRI